MLVNERPLYPKVNTRSFIKRPMRYQTEDVIHAVWSINRHAKTSPSNRFMYALKRKALEQLIQRGIGEKIGIDVYPGKRSAQISFAVVSIGNYLFHMPPTKEDFKTLPRYERNENYRNPKAVMPIGKAKAILEDFTGLTEPPQIGLRSTTFDRNSSHRR